MNEKNENADILKAFFSRTRIPSLLPDTSRGNEKATTAEPTSVSICKIKRPPMYVSVRANTCVREHMRCNDVFIGRRFYPPSFVFVSRDYRE